MPQKLRIGILIDSYELPLWEYILIERLINSYYATVELVVLNKKTKMGKSLFSKIIDNRNLLLYKLYSKLDQILFKMEPDAFEPKDTLNILKGVEFVSALPVSTKYSDRFIDEDIFKIKNHKLDVLIRFGFRILRGEILSASKYGVWSYHHGDNFVNRGGPAGFWEVMENCDVTGSVLQILTEDLDAGKVLYRSFSQTDKRSVHQNRNSFYWKSLSFLPRKLEELYNLGGTEFLKKVDMQNENLKLYSNKFYSTNNLSNWLMFKLLLGHTLKYLKDKYDNFVYLDQWSLMYKAGMGISKSFWNFKKIIPPRDRFFADPFFIHKDSKYYVFIEEFIYKDSKGHISVIEMDSKNNHKKPVKIIDKSYHLSYPVIFENENDYFLIPESRSNKTIELYKCIEFPFKWEFQMNLMENVEAVDATLFYHKKKWWLFTNMVENKGASSLDELFLFFSDRLETNKWTPHPLNPIISDVRKSRPAGNIFLYNDKIIRPSQNGSKGYGYGLKINEIKTISENEYEEIEIDSIEPNWEKRVKATHTFNTDQNITMIDAMLRRRRYF